MQDCASLVPGAENQGPGLLYLPVATTVLSGAIVCLTMVRLRIHPDERVLRDDPAGAKDLNLKHISLRFGAT